MFFLYLNLQTTTNNRKAEYCKICKLFEKSILDLLSELFYYLIIVFYLFQLLYLIFLLIYSFLIGNATLCNNLFITYTSPLYNLNVILRIRHCQSQRHYSHLQLVPPFIHFLNTVTGLLESIPTAVGQILDRQVCCRVTQPHKNSREEHANSTHLKNLFFSVNHLILTTICSQSQRPKVVNIQVDLFIHSLVFRASSGHDDFYKNTPITCKTIMLHPCLGARKRM